MQPENKSPISRIQPETQDSRVTIDYRPRNVTMRYVSDQELETIGSSSIQSAIHLAFFGVAGGAAIALGITLNTVTIPDAKTYCAEVG